MERQKINQNHLDDTCGDAKLKHREVICDITRDLCEYIFSEYVEHLNNLASCPKNPFVKSIIRELSQKSYPTHF